MFKPAIRGRVVLFDRSGQSLKEFCQRPYFSSLIEWPNAAIETRSDEGMLVLLDRYETRVDPSRLLETFRTGPGRRPLS